MNLEKKKSKVFRIKKRFVFIIASILVVCLRMILVSYADTVILNSDERIKGVIVEDYKDRIVVSTIDGEKEIMRNDIKSVIYDLEEQNLTNLGDYYQDQGAYEKAYYYYDKALEVNPEYKRARDGLGYLGTYLQQTSRRIKLDQLDRANEESKWRSRRPSATEPTKEEKIERTFGFSLKDEQGKFKIRNIIPGSTADKAGLKEGDTLLSAWGRSVSYMQPEDVMRKLLVPGIMDIQITIGRDYNLELPEKKAKYNVLLGGKLGFSEMDGLILEDVYEGGKAEAAGLRKGDIITGLSGKTTRYMAMEEAADIISEAQGKAVILQIKRDIIMWKKFKEEK